MTIRSGLLNLFEKEIDFVNIGKDFNMEVIFSITKISITYVILKSKLPRNLETLSVITTTFSEIITSTQPNIPSSLLTEDKIISLYSGKNSNASIELIGFSLIQLQKSSKLMLNYVKLSMVWGWLKKNLSYKKIYLKI